MTGVAENRLRRYRPYLAYKDSGVAWLGEVPEHWGVKPLKFAVKMNPEDLSDSTPDDFRITYVDIGSVTQEKGITWTEEYDFLNAPSRARRRVRDGDTIISTVRTYLKAVAAIQNPPDNMVVSTGFAVLRPSDGVIANFLSRAVQSDLFIGRVVSLSEGVSYPAIAPSALARIDLWLPPTDEQVVIAAFLDRENARIDELVAKKERLIELLQEKRTALITRAVTKGLDPNVPMKDSGVEWLGGIPAHWDGAKMWRISKAVSGGTPAKDERGYWDGDIPWVSPKDMKRRFMDSSEDTITERAIAETGIKLVTPPVVLIVVRGMILAHSFPVAITTMPVTINQDMKALRFRHDVDPVFMAWLFEGVGKAFLGAAVEEAAHGTRAIRMDQWRSVVAPVPPTSEQRAIAAFLDRETARIDVLIAEVNEAIERLKEYRTALISAAVTGKIDVRENVA